VNSNNPNHSRTYTAFAGDHQISTGSLAEVALTAMDLSKEKNHDKPLLFFDDETAAVVEMDLRGTRKQVLARYQGLPRPAPPASPQSERGPGRPRLGVVGREVTLLPRHWDWLNEQPGGPSVTLRKLVEEAKRTGHAKDMARRSKEAAYRFMNVMAGNLPGFEEATRAVFGTGTNRLKHFEEHTARWPADVRKYALNLMEQVLAAEAADKGEE
jgi:hypothetical protein